MLQLFRFESRDVRCYGTWDAPIWIAQEICDCLNLQGDAGQHTRRLDEDEKVLISVQTPGGTQEVLGVNEPGLYALVLGCRKPIAKRFKRWITHEVLPSIRKTGSYSLPQESQSKALPPLTQENRLKLVELGSKLVELRHDERLLMALQAEVKNLLSPEQAEPSQPKLMSATEWLGTVGYRPPTKKENWLGRKIAEKWRLERKSEPTTAPKFVGTNHETQIKVYPEDFLPIIIEVTEDYCEVDLSQK